MQYITITFMDQIVKNGRTAPRISVMDTFRGSSRCGRDRGGRRNENWNTEREREILISTA